MFVYIFLDIKLRSFWKALMHIRGSTGLMFLKPFEESIKKFCNFLFLFEIKLDSIIYGLVDRFLLVYTCIITKLLSIKFAFVLVVENIVLLQKMNNSML